MKKSQFISMVLVVVLLMSATLTPVEAVEVTDISSHWARESIQRWVNASIIGGYPDGSFKPNNSITRAEFATILAKTLGLHGETAVEFTDVNTHWAKDAIYACAAAGIVNGYTDGSFLPDKFITRQEAMKMFARATHMWAYNEPEFLSMMFQDAALVQAWAVGYAVAMVRSGAMEGSNGMLRPADNISRAEVAVILDRLLGVYIQKDGGISTTTSAQTQKGKMGYTVAVHPDVDVQISENPDYTATVALGEDIYSIQLPSDGYVLCGTEGAWLLNSQVDVEGGRVLEYYINYLDTAYVSKTEYADGTTEEYTIAFEYDPNTHGLAARKTYENGMLTSAYTADLDEEGRPVKVFADGVLLWEYEYFEGNMSKKTRYLPDGTEDYRVEYTYNEINLPASVVSAYEGVVTENKYEYDRFGNVTWEEVRVDGSLEREKEYFYDESGVLVQDETRGYVIEMVDGELVHYQAYYENTEYQNYSPTRYVYIRNNHKGDVEVYTTCYFTYDEWWNLTERVYYDKDDNMTERYTCAYGEDGRIVTEISYIDDGTELWRDEYSYEDQDGVFITKTEHYYGGELDSYIVYEENYNTEIMLTTEYSPDGTVLSVKKEYDEYYDDTWIEHTQITYAGRVTFYEDHKIGVLIREDFEMIEWDDEL